ncbi:MAG: hypothetical protein QOH16_675 [Gaiellaceae bacterium]|nr:hypothetical protein [Gaiellaceae bacterium]
MKASNRDLTRQVVQKHRRLWVAFKKRDEAEAEREFKHPHGHLMAETPVMKNLRDR